MKTQAYIVRSKDREANMTPANKLRHIIDLLDDPAFGDLDPIQMQRAEKALGSLLESAEDDGDDLRRVLMSPPMVTQTARALDGAAWAYGKLGETL